MESVTDLEYKEVRTAEEGIEMMAALPKYSWRSG